MIFLADYFHCIAEEIGNASVVVPRSMLSSVILNGILGFSMLVTVLFSAGDYEQAVNSPTQYPFIEIIAQAVGSNKGATAMVRPSAPRFKIQKANQEPDCDYHLGYDFRNSGSSCYGFTDDVGFCPRRGRSGVGLSKSGEFFKRAWKGLE